MAETFGLDIGSTSIKIIQLAGISQGFRLLAAGIVPTPPKGLASEAEVDQEALALTIKKLTQDAKVSTKFVITSLPEAQIFTRVLEMPALSDRELASAIQWEAEQVVPLPLEDVSLDFQVLSRPKKPDRASKMEILLVAAPKILIEKYLKILGMAGLTPLWLETETLAISRALSFEDPLFPTSLFIHLGSQTTDLTVIRGKIIAFTRSIPTGGKALARAVAQSLGLEESQAEEYKRAYGFEEEKLEGKILAAIKPVFNAVLEEIKRSMAFYQEKNPQEPLKRVVLVGGAAKLPGITAYLAQELGLEVQVGNPWQKIQKDEKLTSELEESGPIFTTAVGLAMKEVIL